MREDTKKFLKELFQGGYRASTIGLTLVFCIMIGFFIGYGLSKWLDNSIFIILGLIVGIIAGFRQVYVLGQKYK